MADQTAVPVPQLAAGTDPSLKRRLYLMMFLQYFVQGAYLPVISVYLQDALRFTPEKIGLFGSALAIGPLVAPFIIGQIVDRHVATERVLAFCHLLGGCLMLALYWVEDWWPIFGGSGAAMIDVFWPIVVLGAIYSTLYVPSMMLTNSLTFHHLKNRDREFPAIRLWGTIGFVVPAWLVELYFLKGLEGAALNNARGIILALSGGSGLVMGLYCLTLPHTPPSLSERKELAPGKVFRLLKLRSFLVLVLVSLVIAVAHKFFFVWNSPFLKDVLRLGEVQGAWEQRISSIGQIFEVAVMAVLGFAVKRYGFKWTMIVGATAYTLRCLIFAAAISFDEAPFALVMTSICVGQALHGFCFGCFLAAAYMYVDHVASADVRGSMQTFYGTFVVGVGLVAGGFISGKIGEVFTTLRGIQTLRQRLGLETTLGLTHFTQGEHPEIVTEWIRDWPGIWLAGAAIAAVGAVAFWLFFPKDPPGESG